MPSSLNEFDSVWAPPNKAVDDRGATHDRIQDAVDNATAFVFIGPGTFNENVTITTDGLEIRGAGTGTVIDGGTGRPVEVDANNVNVEKVAVQNTLGANNDNTLHVATGADNVTIRMVRVNRSDSRGIRVVGDNAIVTNCVVRDTESDGINFTGSCEDGICQGNQVVSGAADAIQISGVRCTVVGNVCDSSTNHGIDVFDDANVIVANSINNASMDGINDNGTGTVIACNTITGSTDSAINTADATNPIVGLNHPASANP